MSLDPQKTIINGQTYENVPAEVVSVDFDGKSKEKLYTIQCRLIGAFGSQAKTNIVAARALDANIKNIPLKGEVVMLMKGPTAYNSALRTAQEYYYTNPVSIQSSIHHNGLPGVTDVGKFAINNSPSKRQNAEDGVTAQVTSRLQVNKTIDPGFPERNDVYPIQPFPGDIIIEGRWGQSIRFGSTVDERRAYPQRPLWKKGLGDTGNPILIISNGTNPDTKPFNEFILEDPDKDDSAIWMTSGQTLNFTPASRYKTSAQNRSVDLHTTNTFAGNQILLASDRIILNARRQEIMAFSSQGIGLSSDKGVTIDGGQVIELESERINLGINAVSPVLMGDRTLQWLGDLCDSLANLCTHISNQTHPTGTGPSGPPINAASFNLVKSQIKSLRSSLKNLPSDLVFVCESSGGPSAAEQQKAEERSASEKGYVEPTPTSENGGDRANSLAAEPENPQPVNVVTILTDIKNVEEEKQKILKEISEKSGVSLDPQPVNIDPNDFGTSGTSGTEGFGTNGTSGTSGTDGFGTNGTSGTEGFGTNGTSGTSGTEGLGDNVIPGTVSSTHPNGITFEEMGVDKSKMKLVNGKWDYDGSITFTGKNILNRVETTTGPILYEIPIPFGKVKGSFIVEKCKLKSLKNSPEEAEKFFCSDNDNLTSLEGGPKKVNFYGCKHTGITNLLGGPEYVRDGMDVRWNNLSTLNGAPKKFGDKAQFDCSGNVNLKSLSGLPDDYTGWVFQRVAARDCNLSNNTIFDGMTQLKITGGSISVGSQNNYFDEDGVLLNVQMIKEFTGAANVFVE